MAERRILGLDPGSRRIGVALSDPTGTIATPLTVLDADAPDLARRLRELVAEHAVERIVVGRPTGLSGAPTAATESADRFAEFVAEATGLRVDRVDERFTTVIAERAMLEGDASRRKRRARRDQVAAAVLLQGYLDASRR